MTRKRYRHYLEPTKVNRWPNVVVAVDCASVDANTHGGAIEELACWHADVLHIDDDHYTITRMVTGSCADSWWNFLWQCTEMCPHIWVFGVRCQRQWSLLGLWEAVESGLIRLTKDGGADNDINLAIRNAARKQSADPLGPLSPSRLREAADSLQGAVVIEDPPNLCSFWLSANKGHITWVDTRNYAVDLPSYLQHGSGSRSHISWWFRGYHAACRKHKLGSLQTTAASQAFHGFRSGHYTGGIYCDADESHLSIVAAGYCGGRCEAFRLGVAPHPLWNLDYRACYPYVCRYRSLPSRCNGRVPGGRSFQPASANDWRNAIATVTLRCVTADYPYKSGLDTVWPIGQFRTTLCGPELADAVSRGAVVAVHEAIYYDMGECLASFSQSLFDLRCESEATGNSPLAKTAKAIAVALPGKLGQRNRRWETVTDVVSPDSWGLWHGVDQHGRHVRYRSIAGVVQREVSGDYCYDSVPEIAAFITSYARVMLLEAIRTAGREHVWYVDTDSLIVDEIGLYKIQESELYAMKTWGKLGWRWGPLPVEIIGIKAYIAGGNWTCAGLPRGAKIERDGSAAYELYETVYHAAQHGHKPEARRAVFTYRRDLSYHHGVVHPDGRITPLVINDD